MSKKSNLKIEHVRVQVRAIMLKIYPEMIDGFPDLPECNQQDIQIQKQYCLKLLEKIVSDSDSPYWIHSIVHDSDSHKPEIKKPSKKAKEEEKQEYISKQIYYFWNPELEKIHIHVELITKSGNPTDINTMFNYLAKFGLKIRKEADTIGLMSGWIQKLNMRNKAHIAMMVYHTHETEQAVLDGKHKYDRSEVYTNIPENVLKNWYDIYFNTMQKSEKASEFDYAKKAYQLGRNIKTEKKGFTEFWRPENIPEIICSDSKKRQYALQRYMDGLTDFNKDPEKDSGILRCSIFIGGEGQLGKSVTSALTLRKLGFSVFEVGNGTGKFDELLPSYDAIVADDTSFPAIFDLGDNKIAKLTKRHSGNPLFFGQWVIITYNGTFWDYLDNCYSNANWYGNPSSMDALHSRFYCLDVDTKNHNRLYLDLAHNCKDSNGLPHFRGNPDELAARNQMLYTFMTVYNELILNYHPEQQDKYGIQNLLGDMCRDSSQKTATGPTPAPAPAPGCAASAALLQTNSQKQVFDNFLDDFIQLPF